MPVNLTQLANFSVLIDSILSLLHTSYNSKASLNIGRLRAPGKCVISHLPIFLSLTPSLK